MITGRDLALIPAARAREILGAAHAPGPPSEDGLAAETVNALVLDGEDLSPYLRRTTLELIAAGHALVIEDRSGPTPGRSGHGLRMAGYAGALNAPTVRAVLAASIDEGCGTLRLDLGSLSLYLSGWVAITEATRAFRRRGGLLQVRVGREMRVMSRAWASVVPDRHNVVLLER